MSYFTPPQLASLEATATTAARYLDACDSGATQVRIDPAHYRTCGELLARIFKLIDARRNFPLLLQQSAAAREMAELVEMGRYLALSRLVFYPELAALISRVAA